MKGWQMLHREVRMLVDGSPNHKPPMLGASLTTIGPAA